MVTIAARGEGQSGARSKRGRAERKAHRRPVFPRKGTSETHLLPRANLPALHPVSQPRPKKNGALHNPNVRNTNIGMPSSIPTPMGPLLAVAGLLELAAQELAKEASKRVAAGRRRKKRGETMRPGADTPLWNAVVATVKPRLKQRGARAILARELGVHRARIGEFFDDISAMPDAERTLRLLLLLAHLERQQQTQPGAAQR